MIPENLQPGIQYKYCPGTETPEILIYRYETLNHWAFDRPGMDKLILLHKQQIINNLIEI